MKFLILLMVFLLAGCASSERSSDLAFESYRKAAEQGLAKAQSNLGLMYLNGQGVIQDDKQAVYWFRKAAKQGLVIAQHNLWLMDLKIPKKTLIP